MWYSYIGKLMSKIGSKMAAAGAAIAVFILMILGHRRKVDRAEKSGRKKGVESERNRINAETHKEVSERKDTANEVHEDSRSLDDDDLAKRMLEQQARRRKRNR